MSTLEKTHKELPKSLKTALPYLAVLASIGAFFYSWLMFTGFGSGQLSYWPDAVRSVVHFVLFAAAGVMWLVSAGMFFTKKPRALNVLVSGIYTVVAVLLANLLLLIAVGIWKLSDGTIYEFIGNLENPLTDPRNIVSIVVIAVIIALAVASKSKRKKK